MSWAGRESSDSVRNASGTPAGFEEPRGTNLGGPDTLGWGSVKDPGWCLANLNR